MGNTRRVQEVAVQQPAAPGPRRRVALAALVAVATLLLLHLGLLAFSFATHVKLSSAQPEGVYLRVSKARWVYFYSQPADRGWAKLNWRKLPGITYLYSPALAEIITIHMAWTISPLALLTIILVCNLRATRRPLASSSG